MKLKIFGLVFLGLAITACGAQTSVSQAQTIFGFHNGFWINLHHFLYMAAQASSGIRVLPQGDSADALELTNLSGSEQKEWNDARSYYATSFVHRDLLMDSGLEEIKNELEGYENSPDLKDAKLPPELKSALLSAAPVYRKHWWPRHEVLNREWISQLEPLIGRYGASLTQSLAKIYDVPWPQGPIRVDVVTYANWAGAYTTLYPTRATISSLNSGNQGAAALEIVFHESSHGMMTRLMSAIDVAEKNARAQHRAGLWHEVLFYTSGELVAGLIQGYTPYADKNGLWDRAWTHADRELIRRDWKPHMLGTITLEASVTKLVDDLSAPTQVQTPKP
jgi:hypothetical protein